MTPIYVRFDKDEYEKTMVLQIHSPGKPLHTAEFIEIMEVWLSVYKKQHENEVKEYDCLLKSGKVVSMSQWKKET